MYYLPNITRVYKSNIYIVSNVYLLGVQQNALAIRYLKF